MKHIILSLVCLIFIGAGCAIEAPVAENVGDDQPLEEEQPLTFSGEWVYEDSEQLLILTLDQQEDDLTGFHCYVKTDVQDCVHETLTWSVVGRIQEDGTALIDIMSAQVLDTGKVELKLTDPNTLSWQMVEQPPGQNDFPDAVMLQK